MLRDRIVAFMAASAMGAVWAPCGVRAEPRPYIFGSGHFLSKWFEPTRPLSYDSECMDKIVEMGGTSVWIDFPWAAMEPSPGQIDWSYADYQVDTAEAHGLEMFAFAGTTPEWAKLYPALPSHRTPPAEEYVDEFQSFHTQLAARYAGRVKYYQFWNEPSGCGWINEGCANGDQYDLFTLWLGRWYQAMKAGDATCVLSAAGLDGYPPPYVQGMYDYIAAHGGGEYFDAISVHPYGDPLNWEAVADTYATMVANGDAHKRIWITEWGYATPPMSQQQQANNVTAVLNGLKQPAYDYVFYAKYLIVNDGTDLTYGLMDVDLNPKQAWYAFRDFDKAFPDSSSPFVVNPSFEDAGGSLNGWHVTLLGGEGPDDPPLDNTNLYGPRTPFGDHFGGKVTSWLGMNFRLGQILEVADYDPASVRVDWSLSAYVQLHCHHDDGSQLPDNVHQIWEIGWNNDGSLPDNMDACDNYTTVADIDGTYTGNDMVDFYPLTGSGSIEVGGLQYVVFRVHMFNDTAREWSMVNVDNVSFDVAAITPAGPADFDQDGDVDEDDYDTFAACYSGPAGGIPSDPPPYDCTPCDLDGDDDVDLTDLATFQCSCTGSS